MPRPKSKVELLERSEKNFTKLLDLLNSYSEAQLQGDFPLGTMNRNVKDILAHLHEWHLMMLKWYEVGMRGEKPEMPAKGYNWKTLPDLNKKIWESNKDIEHNEALRLFSSSYLEARKLIKIHSDEELFEKKKYKWTGTTSLAEYLISNTSSHYDWAYKLIKKSMR